MTDTIQYPIYLKCIESGGNIYRKPTKLELLKALFGIIPDLKIGEPKEVFKRIVVNKEHLLKLCNEYFVYNNIHSVLVGTIGLNKNFSAKIDNPNYKVKKNKKKSFLELFNLKYNNGK